MSFSSPAKTVTHSANARLRGDDGRAPLVAVGEQIEEQLAAGPIEGDKAELVDDQDVDPAAAAAAAA